MRAVFSIVAAAFFLMGGRAAAQQPTQPYASLFGWSVAKYVREDNGKLSGAWVASAIACLGAPPAITTIDTTQLLRLTLTGNCNGEPEYYLIRRAAPLAVPDGACGFDYVTVGGLIPGVFQEVTEKTAAPGAMEAFHQALPDLRHVFATKQAGGMIALTGWYERPAAASAAAAEKTVTEAADHAHSAGQLNYKIVPEQIWAMLDVRDYQNAGKQRRDVGMTAVDTRGCLFSAKFTRARDPGDDGVWASLDREFDRMRRVISNYETGRPWALDGAK